MRAPFWDPRVQWRSYTISLKQRKKYRTEIGHIEKGKRKIPTSPVTSSSTAQCQERHTWPVISPAEESENMWVSAQLPQLCVKLLRTPTSFSPLSEYRGDLHNWRARRGWKHSSQGSEFNRGTVPLTTLQTPSGSLPMSRWGHHLWIPPNWPITITLGLQHAAFHTHTLTHLMCAPEGSVCNLCGHSAWAESWLNPAGLGESIHTWGALNYPRKSKHETQHSAGLYGIRRGIQS